MKKQLKEINVGSLLKEIDTATEANLISEGFEKGKRTKAEYEIVFSDTNDFAIRKTNKRTNKLLVSIYSKNLLYFYDAQTDSLEKITKAEQLLGFFSDMKADEIVIPKETAKYLECEIRKAESEAWFEFVTANQGIRMFVLSGLYKFDRKLICNENRTSLLELLSNCYMDEKSLLRYIISNSENVYDPNDLKYLLTFAYDILSISDLSTAKYYFDKQKVASIKPGHTKNLQEFKEFSLNPRRFIDYILFDLYKQGKNSDGLRTYYDYLSMSKKYYGTVKEKYPKYLMTEHSIISSKLSEKAKVMEVSEEFENVMNECENFGYSTLTDKFVIAMPKISLELVDEGSYLCHCVASYVDKVVSKDCIVVFMRLKDEKDTPYLTIEILPDRSITQVEGMNKRSELTEEECEFILKWAKARSLKVTAVNVVKKK